MSRPATARGRADARALYEVVITPLRERARELGYALAVHGSLANDVDLVAVPWTSRAVSAWALAEALQAVVKRALGMKHLAVIEPHHHGTQVLAAKPHGRLAWNFVPWGCAFGGAYVDLSVMPRRSDPPGRR